jgi:hypothetical protein
MRYVVPAKEPITLFDSAISVTASADDTIETIVAKTGAPGWIVAQVNKINADTPLRPGQSVLIPRIAYSAKTDMTAISGVRSAPQ